MTELTASKSAAAIDRARDAGRSALVCYLPAGYPDVQATIDAGIADVLCASTAKGPADVRCALRVALR